MYLSGPSLLPPTNGVPFLLLRLPPATYAISAMDVEQLLGFHGFQRMRIRLLSPQTDRNKLVADLHGLELAHIEVTP